MPQISDQVAQSFVDQLARGALEGAGPLAPARQVASNALAAEGDEESAIDAIVAEHLRLAALNGFVTSLGGVIMLPVAMPANLLGFYTLAARMVAAIADVRGEDLDRRETRLAVLLTLTGDDASQVLQRAGAVLPGGGITARALRRINPATAAVVNRAIGFRLLVRAGGRGIARLSRAIPLAGGIIGGAIDVAWMHSIARHARERFPAREHVVVEHVETVRTRRGGRAPSS
jgi:hypothetical protein